MRELYIWSGGEMVGEGEKDELGEILQDIENLNQLMTNTL